MVYQIFFFFLIFSGIFGYSWVFLGIFGFFRLWPEKLQKHKQSNKNIHTFPYHHKFITQDKRFRIYYSLQLAKIQRGIDSHSFKKMLRMSKIQTRNQNKS